MKSLQRSAVFALKIQVRTVLRESYIYFPAAGMIDIPARREMQAMMEPVRRTFALLNKKDTAQPQKGIVPYL